MTETNRRLAAGAHYSYWRERTSGELSHEDPDGQRSTGGIRPIAVSVAFDNRVLDGAGLTAPHTDDCTKEMEAGYSGLHRRVPGDDGIESNTSSSFHLETSLVGLIGRLLALLWCVAYRTPRDASMFHPFSIW
ncbi:MAG TPA: hypothetical protein VGO75_08705 [Gemmatimonadaceae bacterium]|nr:hypothetical protein [Gemmatimonadaceae bacterium]